MKVFFAFLLLIIPIVLNAQDVGIKANATISTPEASAVLTVVSANSNTGVIVPIMTSAQMNTISLPANGLLIYNSDLDKFMYNAGANGTAVWTFVGEAPSVTTNPNGILSSIVGDLRYCNCPGNYNFYYCNGGTSWTALTSIIGN